MPPFLKKNLPILLGILSIVLILFIFIAVAQGDAAGATAAGVGAAASAAAAESARRREESRRQIDETEARIKKRREQVVGIIHGAKTQMDATGEEVSRMGDEEKLKAGEDLFGGKR